MGLELAGVHVYEKVPGTTNETRLVKTNPYVRIGMKDHTPIFIQGGRFYSEGGPEVTEFPVGFDAELAKLSPRVRAEVGLQDVAAPPAPVVEAKPDAMWTCPDAASCQQKMPISTRKKGLHVAKFHRRRTETAGSI
jgi:hypothetical protein